MKKMLRASGKICGINPYTLLFVLCAVLLLALLPAGRVEAHANYDHSNPAANYRFASGQAPTRVQVWFTEDLEPSFSNLKVYDSNRQRVDLDDSRVVSAREIDISLKANLPDDVYTVVFSNVSADDGHANTGGFSFVVGGAALPSNTALLQALEQPVSNFNVWSIAIRWLGYLGLAGLIGGFVFLLAAWRPALNRVRASVGNELTLADKRLELRTRQLALWSLLVLLIAWGAFLLYQASTVSDSPVWLVFGNGAISSVLFKTRFGLLWLVRLGLLVLAFLGWLLVRRRPPGAEGADSRVLLLIVVGLAIALTTSLDAHAAGSNLNWLLVPIDLLHLTGMSFWFGGLLIFALAVPLAVRALVPGTGDRTRLLAALIPQFTRVALLSVALLVVTGTTEAIVLVGSFSALFGSDYGHALIVKWCIFMVLLAFGAFHMRLIGPRMRTFAAREDEEGGASSLPAGSLQRIFLKSLRNEALFAALLLLSVGALTSLSPPPPPANASTTPQHLYQGQMGDLHYTLAISPGTAGPNTFDLSLTDSQNKPLQKADSVFARFVMEDMDMGVQVLDFTPVQGKPGLYQASGTQLAMFGHWGVTLIVQRTGFDEAKTTIQITLNE